MFSYLGKFGYESYTVKAETTAGTRPRVSMLLSDIIIQFWCFLASFILGGARQWRSGVAKKNGNPGYAYPFSWI